MPPKPAAKTAAKPAAKAAAPKAAAKPAAKAAAPKAAAPTGNGAYVKGLGAADVDAVKAIFAVAGKITDVRLRRNKFALVHFENAAGVAAAISKFNGKDVKGAKLSVVAAKAGPKVDARLTSKVVFVTPIFAQATCRKQVRALFATCGKVAKLKTYRNNFAFVYFADAASAKKCLAEKNGATFNGRKITVKPSVRQ